jgi:hypothetical protein
MTQKKMVVTFAGHIPASTYGVSCTRSTRRVGSRKGAPKYENGRIDTIVPSRLQAGDVFAVNHVWGVGGDHEAVAWYVVTRNAVSEDDGYEFDGELDSIAYVRAPEGACTSEAPCAQCVRVFGQ